MRAKLKISNFSLQFIFATLFCLGNCLELLLKLGEAHATLLAGDQRNLDSSVGREKFGPNLGDDLLIKHSPRKQTTRHLNGKDVLLDRSQGQVAKFATLHKYAAKFKAYKKLFRKHYANLIEQMNRFRLFIASYLRVTASKLAYSSNRLFYYLKLSKFSDLSRDERRNLVGSSREKALEGVDAAELIGARADAPKLTRLKRNIMSVWQQFANMPKSSLFDGSNEQTPVDWRHSPDRCLAEQVADQGDCNSCYAMSGMRLFEWLHCRQQSTNLASPVRFSEQYLVDCGKPFGLYGCQSGTSKGLLNFVRSAGLLEASKRSYTGKEAQCGPLEGDENWLEIEFNQTKAMRHAAALVPKEVEFEFVKVGKWLDELRQQPLLVWVDLSDDFYEYGGGLYEPSGECDRELGHFMLMVGYGHDTLHNRPYWLLYNSFGPQFGELGYVRVPTKSLNTNKKSDYQTNCLLYAIKTKVDF